MPTGASQKLIELAINDGPFKGQGGEKPADVTDKNFHCVIHVLRWSDPDATEKQTVVAQNWYVYNNGNAKGLRSDRIWSQEDFTTADRIYGVKRRKNQLRRPKVLLQLLISSTTI